MDNGLYAELEDKLGKNADNSRNDYCRKNLWTSLGDVEASVLPTRLKGQVSLRIFVGRCMTMI